MPRLLLCAVLALLAVNPVSPRPLKGIVIPQHGVLKQLSKKTILLLAADTKLVTIKRSSKTKFFEAGHEIKALDVTVDSIVNIDVTEDNDLHLLALAVKVEKAVARQGGVLIER